MLYVYIYIHIYTYYNIIYIFSYIHTYLPTYVRMYIRTHVFDSLQFNSENKLRSAVEVMIGVILPIPLLWDARSSNVLWELPFGNQTRRGSPA